MASTVGSEGIVLNPTSTQLPDSQSNQPGMGRQGDYFVSEIHGKFYHANYRGGLFHADVTAVTIPVVANNLVSVFSLFNPATSGVMMEIVDIELGQVLATTVVDTVGLYYSTNWQSATLTTLGTSQDMVIGRGKTPQGRFYSALTHSGTPTRIALIAAFGATTDPSLALPRYLPDGKLLIPPGTIVSVAMSTAAGTTSGLDVGATWAEWPL